MKDKITLKKFIQRQILSRVVAVLCMLLAVVLVLTLSEIKNSFSSIESSITEKAKILEDDIISEILVANESSIPLILDGAQDETGADIEWVRKSSNKITSGIYWDFPFGWTLNHKVKSIDSRDFGAFVFKGSFWDYPGLLSNFFNRLLLMVFMVFSILLFIWPIATSLPKKILSDPIEDLLLQLSGKKMGRILAAESAYSDYAKVYEDVAQILETNEQLEEEKRRLGSIKAVKKTIKYIVHDLKKPFGTLQMVMSSIEKASSPETVSKIVKQATPGVQRSFKNISSMLDELQDVGVNSPVFYEEVDPKALVESVIKDIRLSNKNLNIQTKFSNIQNIHVDPEQLSRVISNILINAVQASGSDEKIWIETDAVKTGDESYQKFIICNTGSYIRPELQEKVFDFEMTRGKLDGKGLGLSICKSIIESHNGRIWCESDQLEGTRFIFTIPSNAFDSNICIQEQCNSNELDILLVDDEKVTITLMEDTFKELEKQTQKEVNIRYAGSAQRALEELDRKAPDMIISDVDMGNNQMDGYEFVKQVRASGYEGKVVIQSHNLNLKKAMKSGADVASNKYLNLRVF